MNITPDDLDKEINKTELNRRVKTELDAIEFKITNAHANKRSDIIHELPVNFDIPGMTRKDAQLVIYTDIIEHLIERKWKVQIKIESEKTILRISWVSALNEKDTKRRKELLVKYMVKQK